MTQLFLKGGPIMWPLLVTSVIALAVILERLVFLFREWRSRDDALVDAMLESIEQNQITKGIELGSASASCVARVLSYGLTHRETSLSNALLRASNIELQRYNRGLSILDTIITLAPLLGLLGTVTGMISAFGLLGASELDAPLAITGGIAEALIATAFGLGVAICSLLPFNYLNSRLEEIRHELEDRTSQLELIMFGPAARGESRLAGREAA